MSLKTLALSIAAMTAVQVTPGFLQAAETPAANQQPNVLFLIADDLNLALGCYGASEARTPNIDRLAAEGVRFTRAYGQGAVCTPSRNAFITGMSTRTVGLHDTFVQYQKRNPEATSMGRHFRQNGYQTIAIGKVEHSTKHQDPQAWSLSPDYPKNTAKLVGREEVSDPRQPKRIRMITQIYAEQDKTDDGLRTDQFVDFIEHGREPGKPFFAALGFHSPHEPHEVYQRNLDAMPLERMPLVHDPVDASPFNPFAFCFAPWYPDEATQRKNVRSYYAAVSQMDEQVGRIIDLLERNHLKDDTIIVFIADNGYNLGYRGQWAKHDVYPDVAHLPLIVRYPKAAKAGTAPQGLVEMVDIFPTLSELAGLPAVPKLDGQSFVRQLQDPTAPGKAAAYIEWEVPRSGIEDNRRFMPAGQTFPDIPVPNSAPNRAVYTERWCYTEVYGTGLRELYDLSSDPQAYRNVVDQHPQIADEQAKLLHAYFPIGAKRGQTRDQHQ
jgi:arylsulfatase A-like enzyme